MILKKVTYLITLFFVINSSVFAQRTTIYTHTNTTYNAALELYDKEKFSAAQEKFSLVLKNIQDDKSEITVNSMYYHALCGLELFNIDAENLLIEFVYAYPESPKVKLAYFHLGRYKFRKKKYDEALEWFAKIDVYDLSEDELAEYHFKTGYSHFMEEDYEKASTSFYEIKDVDTKYSSAAKYYYGHIAYLQKKYESALLTFLSLNKNTKFSPIVPYYITQIYYLQKNYTRLIEYAPALLDTAIPKRAPEISRLIGEAYYHTNKFSEAIPYLKRYHKEMAYNANRADKYELGYAYYKIDSCQLAINWFKKAIGKDDSLTQTAHYHIAECYLKLGEKKYARNSFRIASQLKFDPQIKEDALFSFAKISYELSIHPYNDAILAFEEFINTYPNSTKLNTAYEFLVAVYFTTKNYKAALTSLENIKNRNIQLEEAYQKIAYYRGIELFNNRKYSEAIIHFDKSDKYQLNKKVKADNTYWRAEANYRLKNYQQAIIEYKKYIFEPEAIITDQVNKAHYGIGYSYFKLKEYNSANQWFRKYVQNAQEENTKIKNDALNRSADCFYITKNYKAAIEYYDKATMLGLDKVDYSLYQSAIVNGVVGNYKDKVNLLQTLINQKEKSHLLDDAIFQLGKTQLIINEKDSALANFKYLIKDYPNSPYLSQAMIKEGLIYYSNKDDENALTTFKKVVNTYPKTVDAFEALQKIKKIYIDRGELAPYENYLVSIGGADSSTIVLDGDYYEVAENSYMNNECKKSVKELTSYLEKYPNGNHLLNAHYYRGDCEYRSGYVEEALIDFNYITSQTKNKFTETALLKAGKINIAIGKLEVALNNFSKLEYLADIPANVFEAQVEQMRLNFQLKRYEETIKYCELIINKDVDDANLVTESHLIYGKSVMVLDNYNLAVKEFTIASTSANGFGAEAKYNLAYIQNLKGEYENCEAEIFSLIKNFSSYSYWIGKSLILLADNYVAAGDTYQAKVTLKNVIEKSKFTELTNIANEKLTLIHKNQIAAARKSIKEEPELDINLFINEDFEKLFNEKEEIIDEEVPKINNSNNNELEDTLKDE